MGMEQSTGEKALLCTQFARFALANLPFTHPCRVPGGHKPSRFVLF